MMKVSGFRFFQVLPQHETLRAIALMRFIAVICLTLVLLFAEFRLGIILPIFPLVAVLTLLISFNTLTWWRMQRVAIVSNKELFLQLSCDVAALSVLLYFSGGATNPFVSFYLPALAVGAALLPSRYALLLACMAISSYSLMTTYYVPLHIDDPDRAINYHLAGMWANFTVSAALITWFVARLSRMVRERDKELSLARERHLENQRLVALGIQAANAAHELGTPLSTVAIIVGELIHANDLVSYQEEFVTIESQIALCKTALERMGKPTPETPSPTFIPEWLMQFIDSWRLRHPQIIIETLPAPSKAMISHYNLLAQILTILLDNAAQAISNKEISNKEISNKEGKICLSMHDDHDTLMIKIADNGPGIAADLLLSLGHREVISNTNGRGIGLLLAFASAQQIGATIHLAANPGGGTCATLTIPIA